MNEIDFKQLRRQERKNARSSSHHGNQDDDNDASESSNQVHPLQNETGGNPAPSAAPDTLLPEFKLTEQHRIHPPQHQLDSVYYTSNFLNKETCKEVCDWLHCLPEYGTNGISTALNEQEESKKHNGKWTRLKHARRKGLYKYII
jgi:hypothetical protein